MADQQSTARDPIGSALVREDSSFADIVGEFVEGLGDRLATMEEAIRGGDFEALRAAAHQLKGSGGGYGYPILTERAGSLEQLAKAGILDGCEKTVTDLRELCERVVVATDDTDDEG